MAKKKQATTDVMQLSLFVEQQLTTRPIPIQPAHEISQDEMARNGERFLSWGKRMGYPMIKIYPKTFGGKTTTIDQGEQAWRDVLLHKPDAWICATATWLEKAETGAAYTMKQVRQGRGEMLLMYARKKDYPALEVEGHIFEPGLDAWQVAAFAIDLPLLEVAIALLAEVKYTPRDIVEMEEWLRAWGKVNNYPGFGFPFCYPPRNEDKDRRFGAINYGEERWAIETRYPYGKRGRLGDGTYENYPGEWLEKCIDQCKRFDSREETIPWQIARERDERKKKPGYQEKEEDE